MQRGAIGIGHLADSDRRDVDTAPVRLLDTPRINQRADYLVVAEINRDVADRLAILRVADQVAALAPRQLARVLTLTGEVMRISCRPATRRADERVIAGRAVAPIDQAGTIEPARALSA